MLASMNVLVATVEVIGLFLDTPTPLRLYAYLCFLEDDPQSSRRTVEP